MTNSADKTLCWGIIGCGDVTEVKSGPAFNKVGHSKLVAVMRRNANKAADYAKRHNVPKWYSDATDLINDPEINAIYVATPPKFHEQYAIQALQAGKYVYVEKPVTTDIASCRRMIDCMNATNGKLVVAHYRRALPMFLAIKKMIGENTIGEIKLIQLKMLQPHQSAIIATSEENWRVDPAIAGGGLFFDLAPHQLDIISYIFGKYINCAGTSVNNAKLYEAEDTVVGYINLPNDILFSGSWCFTTPGIKEDECRIIGEKGSISFPFFGNTLELITDERKEELSFEHPTHIQEPMINKVVQYFLGNEPNPCSLEEAIISLEIMEKFRRESS
ncbi:MAG TPA: Gfo/Idh/MocA family oxidoreductase [Ferruginibacter sp.]|nr:Gfo/Idh/MocA family oxidoreductase [Ferruginibacter sp.]